MSNEKYEAEINRLMAVLFERKAEEYADEAQFANQRGEDLEDDIEYCERLVDKHLKMRRIYKGNRLYQVILGGIVGAIVGMVLGFKWGGNEIVTTIGAGLIRAGIVVLMITVCAILIGLGNLLLVNSLIKWHTKRIHEIRARIRTYEAQIRVLTDDAANLQYLAVENRRQALRHRNIG